MPAIFCPTCDTLILGAPACAACGWRRPIEIGDAGQALWQADLGRPLPRSRASAAIAGERFCVSAEDGTIVALDLASGQIAWERQIGAGRLRHTLASDGARLFVCSVDIQAIPTPGTPLQALDPMSGATLWELPTAAHSLSGPAVATGTLFFTTSDGQLHAADAASGTARWAAKHGVWAAEAPAAAGGLVCAGGRESVLIGYAAENGAQLWRFAGAGAFAGPIRMVGETAYACCWDGCLYALDARTGALRWRLDPERGDGITSAPAVAGGQLFVGTRVYRDPAARAGNGYVLLALDAKAGTQLWRYETSKHVTAPPLVAEGLVLFGADDGTFRALDAASGQERWQIALGGRLVTPPLLAGDYVYLGERAGGIHAIRWRLQPAAVPGDPLAYLGRGEFELAAIAHALRGDLGAAAGIYERKLAEPRHAAQLYERAEQHEPAARLWEQAGEARRARALYERAGSTLDVARMLAETGELLESAKLYEGQGQLARAATLYEQAGDRGRAAELYHRVGQLDQAKQIWQSQGEWERLADALIGDGQFAAAAELLAQHQQIERAAELYERAGQWTPALELRVALKHWERVASLAARAGDPLSEANAYVQLGQPLAAAQAIERAARRALEAEPAVGERAAQLYERAARLYDTALADEDFARCREQIARLRQQPDIVISGGAQTAFVELEWNTLGLQIKNTGYGPALQIQIAFRGHFDIDGNSPIARVAPARTVPAEIYVRPQLGHYGPRVPLEIIVTYRDRAGVQSTLSQRIPLRVLPRGSASEQDTPLAIELSGSTPPRAGGPEPEEIEQQQQLLITHRRNLAHYIAQKARFGEALVPAYIATSIDEERDQIRRIKRILSGWGIPVNNHPDDEANEG